MRAAGWALSGSHFDGAFRSGAAAILFRAVITCASLARNIDFPSHGFVARDLFLNELNHAAFAASVNFFGDGVKMAGFYLHGLRAITRGLTADPKHGTA